MSTDLVIVSTVLTPATATPPASAYDLVDLATVKAELGITGTDQDTFLQKKITRVSARMNNYCDRVFQIETVQDVIYPARPAGGHGALSPNLNTLVLSRSPLVAVTSVTLSYDDGTTAALTQGTDYLVRSGDNIAELIHLGATSLYPCPWGRIKTTIVYQAGYATVPYDLAEAALQLVAKSYQEKGRDPSILETTEGGITTKYWVDTKDPNGAFPPDILDILDNFRGPNV